MGNQNKTVTGFSQTTESALCYMGMCVTGLIFLLLSKDNLITRFHAFQSLVVFGTLFLLWILLNAVPYEGWSLLPLWGLSTFTLWLVLVVAAYQGVKVTLPFISRWAREREQLN